MPCILSNRSLIKIIGEDSNKFLQNLLTNDISNQAINYSMMLSAQGRFLFDIFTIKIDDGFLLDIFEPTKDVLIKKLNLYKMKTQISISAIETRVAYSRTIPDTKIYYKDPRFHKLGYRFITDEIISNDNSYFEDKYAFAIPDGGVDLLYDNAMPQEYGAEEMNAISFTKGCYVGQEVISRTKYQGQVRKKIYKITSNDLLDDVEHGTPIMSSMKKIGIFCSGYKQLGIALIREENIEDGKFTIYVNNKEIKIYIAEWYNS